jgi:sec-independent protein translocase protein TatB
VFGLDSEKFIILAVLAAVVLGPQRMQVYARQIARWIRQVRDYADNAQSQLSEEIGEDVDWRKLDPRQYDPRRIIREALLEPDTAAGVVLADEAAAAVAARAQLAPTSSTKARRLGEDETAPFDSEAT